MLKTYHLIPVDEPEAMREPGRFRHPERRVFNLTEEQAAVVRQVLELANDPRDPQILVEV